MFVPPAKISIAEFLGKWFLKNIKKIETVDLFLTRLLQKSVNKKNPGNRDHAINAYTYSATHLYL